MHGSILTWMRAKPSLLAIHFQLTFIVFWWCFVLAQPGDTMTPTNAFRVFLGLMPEYYWQVATGIGGVIGLFGIFFSQVRLPAAFILAIVHAFMAGMLAAAPPLNTGTGVYASMSLMAFYSLWQQQTHAIHYQPERVDNGA